MERIFIVACIILLSYVVGVSVYYIRKYRELKNQLSYCKSQLENSQIENSDLKKRKLTRIRIGDTFQVNNTGNWVHTFRGTRCTIIEILDDGIICHNNVKDENGDNKRWKVNWDALTHMIFLSTQPLRPFESNFYETK